MSVETSARAIVNNMGWRIGGQQGEGIDSTGDIFAKACARYGLRITTYRSFSSRIRGGLTYVDVRVGDKPVYARPDQLDYVVALGQEVIDGSLEFGDLADGCVILYDKDAFEPELPDDEAARFHLVGVPMTKIAEESGNKIMKNMVAMGATARLLDMDLKVFYEFIEERWGAKGDKIVNMNKKAVQAAYDFAGQFEKKDPHRLERRPLPDNKRRLVLNANSAASYGALVGGCRFVAGYPITPATDVMEWFVDHGEDYGATVLQSEDELAAINAALGAAFAGVRTCVSTSGPGLSLMTEGLGLAGMAEIPVVLMDIMRPGPSTGLPTKHSQADLQFVLNLGHDDFPRVIVSPTTIEEAFYYAAECFNWAEEYQLPVFFLQDQDLALTLQTIDRLDVNKVKIRRGKLLTEADLSQNGDGHFKRFENTEDGISPRTLPGTRGGLFHSSGSEHDEYGVITENRVNRDRMMEKRDRKLKTFTERELNREVAGHAAWGQTYGPEDATVGVITWGSTRAITDEAIQRIQDKHGIKIKTLVLNVLWPFPAGPVREFLQSVDRAIVAEHNFSGHLCRLIREQVGFHDKLHLIAKYNGNPMRPQEAEERILELARTQEVVAQ